MSPLVTSALARRDRLWPAVAASAVAHAVLVAWGLSRQPPPAIDLQQKPIVAKLVRLGEKRPEQWLPRKEAPPPAAAQPPAPAAPAPPPAAVAPRPAAPAAKPSAPAPSAPAPAAPAPAARPPGTTLASVLSKVQKQVDEDRYGSPDGDPGGDSDTGEGDAYYALVSRAIKANYRVPPTISERERLYLQAGITLWIEPDGRVARWSVEQPSGNATFDAAVERTLKATTRVPPPPEHLRDRSRRTVIPLIFQPR